jgi:hypothetical protein
MGSSADRVGTSAGRVVLIVLGSVVALFVLGPALLAGFGAFLFAHAPHDSFDEVAITNNCDVTLLVGDSRVEGLPATSSAWGSVEPGESFSVMRDDVYVVRVFGGLWSTHRNEGNDSEGLAGADCPVEAEPADLAAVRAPMLAGSELVSVDIASQPPLGNPTPGAEVTTIVARSSLGQASEWIAEYAMTPNQRADGLSSVMLDNVVPGADWVVSRAFNAAVGAEGLNAAAAIDPETGTVVVRLKDSERAS